jgi:hypothetical protein
MPNLQDPKERIKYWTKVASDQLLEKKIVAVRYMTKEEATTVCGWEARPVVLQLDDGNLIYPSMDEEGNGPGVFFTNNPDHSILPVL